MRYWGATRISCPAGNASVYITHDLTTAYHIANSIMVLHRGSVMEAGDTDEVIRSPRHPYTQLLIDSIPWPDLDSRWGNTGVETGEVTGLPVGCRFSGRCPQAMSQRDSRPGLYQLGVQQAAACYLHEEKPALPGEQLSSVMPVAPPVKDNSQEQQCGTADPRRISVHYRVEKLFNMPE